MPGTGRSLHRSSERSPPRSAACSRIDGASCRRPSRKRFPTEGAAVHGVLDVVVRPVATSLLECGAACPGRRSPRRRHEPGCSGPDRDPRGVVRRAVVPAGRSTHDALESALPDGVRWPSERGGPRPDFGRGARVGSRCRARDHRHDRAGLARAESNPAVRATRLGGAVSCVATRLERRRSHFRSGTCEVIARAGGADDVTGIHARLQVDGSPSPVPSSPFHGSTRGLPRT